MTDAMMAAGKDVLIYWKSLKESWISDHIWGLFAQRKLLQQKRQNESNSTFYRDYINKDRKVKRSAQKDKREWFDRQAQEPEDAAARNDETSLPHCQENHWQHKGKIRADQGQR